MEVDTMQMIGQFISQYGFPIVVSAALFWYIVVEARANRKVIEELKQVLSENTKVMTAFTDLVKQVTRNG